MSRFCTKCGSGITTGSRFCNSCGNPVENDFEENRPAQNTSAPVVPEKSTGHNSMLIIALVVVALLIGGIGGYLLFGRSSGDKNTAAKPQPSPAQQAEQAAKPADNAPVPKDAPKAEKGAFIVGTEVNARGSASTESAIVGTFTLGEKVTIISEEPEWARVKRADGQECYVFKKYLGDQAALDERQAKYAGFTNISSGGISPTVTRVPNNTVRTSPIYNENGTKFRFSAVYSSKSGETISFDKEFKSEWKVANLVLSEPMGGHDTMQIKDNASGRIFYALGSNSVPHAYILGYDFEKNKAILYVNSDDFYNPFKEQTAKDKGWWTGEVDFVLRNDILYLVFVPYTSPPSNGEFKPVAYRLFWNSKANKFDYEYVGNF